MKLEDLIGCFLYRIADEDGVRTVFVEGEFNYCEWEEYDYTLYRHYVDGIPRSKLSRRKLINQLLDSDGGAIDWNVDDEEADRMAQEVLCFYPNMQRLDLNDITRDTPCGCYYGEYTRKRKIKKH